MQGTMTVTLPPDVRLEMADIARKEGVSPAALINEAVKDYLFFRKLRLLRERMVAKAQGQGIHSDQDVIDRVS